jgi:phosphoketolase
LRPLERQIDLYDNPLLKQPLKLSHVKPLVVGHWGTTPGLNFVYGFTRIAGRLSGPTASSQNRPL